MAQVPEIKIQLDEEALQKQIRDAIHEEFQHFAFRLRFAADALDGGKWVGEQQQWVKSEYDRGFEAGRKAVSE